VFIIISNTSTVAIKELQDPPNGSLLMLGRLRGFGVSPTRREIPLRNTNIQSLDISKGIYPVMDVREALTHVIE